MSALPKILTELQASNTRLVAVSKTHTPEEILKVYEQGQRDFGENRVQELLPKWESLPKDIRWHLIGHLQTNKVKYIVPFVAMIHSVDSLKLLREIDKQAAKAERVIPCLLQVKIAQEETKYGFEPAEVLPFFESGVPDEFRYAHIQGLMGMASFVEDTEQVRKEFQTLRQIFEHVRALKGRAGFRELSMGMSGDYKVAIEEGSTMVRIGSLLFGPRRT